MAAALASFSTVTDSTSEGLIEFSGSRLMPPLKPTSLAEPPLTIAGSEAVLLNKGTPSTTYKGAGLVLEAGSSPPRILTVSEPPGCAEFEERFRPAAWPCNRSLIEVLATFGRLSV